MVKGRIVFTVVFAVSLWYAHTGSAQAQEPATTLNPQLSPILS